MIVRVESDAAILATRDVMRQLRPDVAPDAYLSTVKRMMRTDGYRIAAVMDAGVLRAVAGYRLIEMLYCGRILVVDDLVTDEHARSRGHGRTLIAWLTEEARRNGCTQLQLDSRVHREAAHRFYIREGFAITCFHFARAIDDARA